jgi:carnitine 3-dehydrogenase
MQKVTMQVSCVGAGTIGSSWATLYSAKGYPVVLHDSEQKALDKAREIIASNLRNLAGYGLLSKAEIKRARDRITYTTNLPDAITDADFIQESVPESLSLKREIFSEISSLASSDVVIASSTGGLLMSRIQSAAKRPERCVVIHPCQIPVHLTRLVEIVPGRLTSRETIKHAAGLMRDVGKKPLIMQREVQDYVTNRLQFTLFREAVDMVGKGIVTAEEVDAALCEFARASFCIGLGPFLQAELHGGPHGSGGIDACMAYYAKILPDTWRSLSKWTQIPPGTKARVEASVRKMIVKRGESRKALLAWRDRSLLAIARDVWAR